MTVVRRHAALLAFALGALRRRLGKNLAVLAALTLVCTAVASVVSLTQALREEARRMMQDLPDVTVSTLRAGRPSTVTSADVQRLAEPPIEGVAGVQMRVWGYLFVSGLNANLVVVGVPAERAAARIARVVDGRGPRANERGWMVLGEGLPRAIGVGVGDGLGMPTPGGGSMDLTVIATFRHASALVTADVAMMDERDARRLLGLRDDEGTDIAVRVSNPEESAVVAAKVHRRLPDTRVVERPSLARAYDLTYGTRGGLLALGLIPALLALLVLAWDRATGLSADERREVGVLKAVGWSTGDVVVARWMEAALLAAAAAGLATVCAHAYVFVAGAPGLREALLGWSSLYPNFALAPAGGWSALLTMASITVAPFLVAAAIPAWRAGVLDPAETLR